MGRYLSSSLMYGWDLGGSEDGWNFIEYDEQNYRNVWPSWMRIEDGEDDPDDVPSEYEDRLIQVIGGFEDSDDWMSQDTAVRNGYYERKREAKKLVGVEFDWYGVSDFMGCVMGFTIMEGHSSLTQVSVDSLSLDRCPWSLWAEKLNAAAEVLEISPDVAPSVQLLVSYC